MILLLLLPFIIGFFVCATTFIIGRASTEPARLRHAEKMYELETTRRENAIEAETRMMAHMALPAGHELFELGEGHGKEKEEDYEWPKVARGEILDIPSQRSNSRWTGTGGPF